MKNRAILVLLSTLLFGHLYSQGESADIRMNRVYDFIEAYNAEDYKRAKKGFPFLVKLLISKKTLENQFSSMRNELGEAKIDTVTYYNKYHYRAQLSFERDPQAREFLSFFFNSKGVLSGLGTSEPSYIYPQYITNTDYSTKNLEARIQTIITEKHLSDSLDYFNGSVLVMDHGEEVFNEAFGYANFEQQTPLNRNSRFDIASCSKQFTAMAIMILVEQGKLNYSDDVTQFIPKLPYKGITIEDLLHHTSGLPSYQQLADKKWDKSQFITNYDLVDLFQEYQPKVVFEAGKSFRYSNTGYAMLALVIEAVAGMSYAEFMEKSIFIPLGMNDTRVYNTKRSKGEVIDNFAHGYVKDPKTTEYILPDSSSRYDYVRYMDNIVGDGSICSSTNDLAIWGNAIINQELVSAASWEKAQTKLTLDDGRRLGYGFGLFLIQEEGMEEVIYHTGGWPGYVTIFLHLPDSEKTIAILSNNSYSKSLNMADDILFNVFFANPK